MSLGFKQNSQNSSYLVASFYPVYSAALNITKDVKGIKVENLTSGFAGCIHDFTLQADDMKKIENSSALIINGTGMEPFIEDIKEKLPELKIINSSESNVKILGKTKKKNKRKVNSHVWLSVNNYINQVNNISVQLCEIFPSHALDFKRNSEDYIKKLKVLELEEKQLCDKISGKTIVCFDSAFDYLADELGLKTVSISFSHHGNLNAGGIVKAVEIIKKSGADFVFASNLQDKKSFEAILNETGAKIKILNLLTSGNGKEDSYINGMKENFKVLESVF
jgi:zinc transport system substrate-binding protein